MKAWLVAGLLFWPTIADAACRQALAIGLDVSGSVDDGEYRLQLDGLAAALDNGQIRAVLLDPAAPPVRLAVYEWSGPEDQNLVLEWTEVTDNASLSRILNTLRDHQRTAADPSTGLGMALRTGGAMLSTQGTCWKRTLDISGDGKSNTGPDPQTIEMGTFTVNGLVIGADNPNIGDQRQMEIGELSSYYRAYVLRGADAFVETALGFKDFEAAMTRKLLRELAGLPVTQLHQ